MKDKEGRLPLHIACRNKVSLEVIRYLVDQCPDSLMVKEKEGRLPLYIAWKNNASLEIIYYLVQQYPNSVMVNENDGSLPPLELIQCMVEQNPEFLKAKDKEGRLPLHHACWNEESLEVVHYLVEQYPESINIKSDNGHTPLNLVETKWLKWSTIESMNSMRKMRSCQRVVDLLKPYLTIRWFRARRLVLLRALVDQGRATLQMRQSLQVAKKGKSETMCELNLLNFVFVTSPEGVFASIMQYL